MGALFLDLPFPNVTGALAAGGLPAEFSRVHPYDHVGCRRRLGASSGRWNRGSHLLFWSMKKSHLSEGKSEGSILGTQVLTQGTIQQKT